MATSSPALEISEYNSLSKDQSPVSSSSPTSYTSSDLTSSPSSRDLFFSSQSRPASPSRLGKMNALLVDTGTCPAGSCSGLKDGNDLHIINGENDNRSKSSNAYCVKAPHPIKYSRFTRKPLDAKVLHNFVSSGVDRDVLVNVLNHLYSNTSSPTSSTSSNFQSAKKNIDRNKAQGSFISSSEKSHGKNEHESSVKLEKTYTCYDKDFCYGSRGALCCDSREFGSYERHATTTRKNGVYEKHDTYKSSACVEGSSITSPQSFLLSTPAGHSSPMYKSRYYATPTAADCHDLDRYSGKRSSTQNVTPSTNYSNHNESGSPVTLCVKNGSVSPSHHVQGKAAYADQTSTETEAECSQMFPKLPSKSSPFNNTRCSNTGDTTSRSSCGGGKSCSRSRNNNVKWFSNSRVTSIFKRMNTNKENTLAVEDVSLATIVPSSKNRIEERALSLRDNDDNNQDTVTASTTVRGENSNCISMHSSNKGTVCSSNYGTVAVQNNRNDCVIKNSSGELEEIIIERIDQVLKSNGNGSVVTIESLLKLKKSLQLKQRALNGTTGARVLDSPGNALFKKPRHHGFDSAKPCSQGKSEEIIRSGPMDKNTDTISRSATITARRSALKQEDSDSPLSIPHSTNCGSSNYNNEDTQSLHTNSTPVHAMLISSMKKSKTKSNVTTNMTANTANRKPYGKSKATALPLRLPHCSCRNNICVKLITCLCIVPVIIISLLVGLFFSGMLVAIVKTNHFPFIQMGYTTRYKTSEVSIVTGEIHNNSRLSNIMSSEQEMESLSSVGVMRSRTNSTKFIILSNHYQSSLYINNPTSIPVDITDMNVKVLFSDFYETNGKIMVFDNDNSTILTGTLVPLNVEEFASVPNNYKVNNGHRYNNINDNDADGHIANRDVKPSVQVLSKNENRKTLNEMTNRSVSGTLEFLVKERADASSSSNEEKSSRIVGEGVASALPIRLKPHSQSIVYLKYDTREIISLPAPYNSSNGFERTTSDSIQNRYGNPPVRLLNILSEKVVDSSLVDNTDMAVPGVKGNISEYHNAIDILSNNANTSSRDGNNLIGGIQIVRSQRAILELSSLYIKWWKISMRLPVIYTPSFYLYYNAHLTRDAKIPEDTSYILANTGADVHNNI